MILHRHSDKHIHFQFLEQGTDEDASVCRSVESTFDPSPAAKQAHQDTWPLFHMHRDEPDHHTGVNTLN